MHSSTLTGRSTIAPPAPANRKVLLPDIHQEHTTPWSQLTLLQTPCHMANKHHTIRQRKDNEKTCQILHLDPTSWDFRINQEISLGYSKYLETKL
jgi:AMMECR1 domain-containing protein